MKKYCIHCGSENLEKNKLCRVCDKPINELDEPILELIKGDAEGKVIDTITEAIIAFIKNHIYGTVLTLSIVAAVVPNIIMSSSVNKNTVETRPESINLISNSKKEDYTAIYMQYFKDKRYYETIDRFVDINAYSYGIIDIDNDGVDELLIELTEGSPIRSARGRKDAYIIKYNSKTKSFNEITDINSYEGIRYDPNSNAIAYIDFKNHNQYGSNEVDFYKYETTELKKQYSIGDTGGSYYYVDDTTNHEKMITSEEYNNYTSKLIYPELKRISDLGL